MKVRADQLLVARGLAPTRARAQALVLAGKVYVGEARIDKAGALLAEVPSQPSAPADTVIAASAKSQSIAEERAVKDEDPVQRGSTETTSPPEAAPAQAAPVSQRVE